MTDLQNNKEMIAVGHEFARTLSSDTPIIEIAKMITRLAGRLDCVTLALREMTKQRDAAEQAERVWERTMMDACGEDGPKSVADKFAELKAQCAALASLGAEPVAWRCGSTVTVNKPVADDWKRRGFDFYPLYAAPPAQMLEIENLEHFISFWRKVQAGQMKPGKNDIDHMVWFLEGLSNLTTPPAPANAEPVAWLWSHRKHPSEVTLVRPEDDDRAEGARWSGWNSQALYAAPKQEVK
ncbi:hypothetical protein QTV03_004379 [Enterobacter roggenkampii]|nr:hypothetical protein [Enterobacter roggenkampii]